MESRNNYGTEYHNCTFINSADINDALKYLSREAIKKFNIDVFKKDPEPINENIPEKRIVIDYDNGVINMTNHGDVVSSPIEGVLLKGLSEDLVTALSSVDFTDSEKQDEIIKNIEGELSGELSIDRLAEVIDKVYTDNMCYAKSGGINFIKKLLEKYFLNNSQYMK